MHFSRNRERTGGFSEYDYYSKIFDNLAECVTVNDSNILRIAEEIYTLEFSDATKHIHKTLYSMLIILVAKLLYGKLYSQATDPLSVIHEDGDTNEQKKIIEQFFQRRYGEYVTIEELAGKLYKSIPQTHRIVKKYFGDSFKKILTRQRMERAIIMIKENDSNFIDVSAACGYNSYGGFLSAFKKYTGVTPDEYKANCRK